MGMEQWTHGDKGSGMEHWTHGDKGSAPSWKWTALASCSRVASVNATHCRLGADVCAVPPTPYTSAPPLCTVYILRPLVMQQQNVIWYLCWGPSFCKACMLANVEVSFSGIASMALNFLSDCCGSEVIAVTTLMYTCVCIYYLQPVDSETFPIISLVVLYLRSSPWVMNVECDGRRVPCQITASCVVRSHSSLIATNQERYACKGAYITIGLSMVFFESWSFWGY